MIKIPISHKSTPFCCGIRSLTDHLYRPGKNYAGPFQTSNLLKDTRFAGNSLINQPNLSA